MFGLSSLVSFLWDFYYRGVLTATPDIKLKRRSTEMLHLICQTDRRDLLGLIKLHTDWHYGGLDTVIDFPSSLKVKIVETNALSREYSNTDIFAL